MQGGMILVFKVLNIVVAVQVSDTRPNARLNDVIG